MPRLGDAAPFGKEEKPVLIPLMNLVRNEDQSGSGPGAVLKIEGFCDKTQSCVSVNLDLHNPKKEVAMKMPKAMMAVMLCAGLVAALGLTACGDDDEEPGMTCEQALAQFTSDDCQTQAFDHVEALNTCLDQCGSVEECDNCFWDFEDEIPACLPGTRQVVNTCNDVWTECGEDFDDCLTEGTDSGTECLTTLVACIDPPS